MTGPTSLAKDLRVAIARDLAKARSDGADDAQLTEALVRTFLSHYVDAVDPDHRMEECEECGRYEADLLMEQPIDGKSVCYDCYTDLGGEISEGDADA